MYDLPKRETYSSATNSRTSSRQCASDFLTICHARRRTRHANVNSRPPTAICFVINLLSGKLRVYLYLLKCGQSFAGGTRTPGCGARHLAHPQHYVTGRNIPAPPMVRMLQHVFCGVKASGANLTGLADARRASTSSEGMMQSWTCGCPSI